MAPPGARGIEVGADAYNRGMPSTTFMRLRHLLLASCCVAPLAWVHAQDAPRDASAVSGQPQAQEPQPDPRHNQKIEHIHVEDAGSAVDEVRYGGRTQSISVQPKASVPAYQVLPSAGPRTSQDTEAGSSGTGPRVWNVMKF
ncbi:MAG: hypothetical protein JWQ03_1743 [Variovorax sp.]|nr:hypothetical protein [Variovorax sp.]